MEIFPQETLLVYASFHGIIYNSNSIPKDKAPKSYEDLVDPVLAKLGRENRDPVVHPLAGSSVGELGKEKVLTFARKLAPLSGGRLPREKRSASSAASSHHGEHRRRSGGDVESGKRRGRAGGATRLFTATSSYYRWGCREFSASNSAKLFVAFMTTREAAGSDGKA